MKKLMIAAAIVCAAAMSQAASVTWSSGALKAAGTGGAQTGDLVVGADATLYTISSTQYSTWFAAITADQATGMKTVYDALNGTTPATDPVKTSVKGIAALVDPTDISTASKTEPVDLYAAVIYSYTDGDNKNWYIANVGTYQAIANSAKTVANMGTKVGGSGAALAWQSVPEPTSGLLLLLGVAGLALRRRRA